MRNKLTLKLAIDRYDRHFPFFDGTVKPPSELTLEVFQVGQSQTCRDGTNRHERMYHDNEFDVCEFGLAPYLMLHDRQPDLPMVALPIFPRRLFSQSQIFVNRNSGISRPADLVGRRVGLRSFRTTLSVLAKGDLKFHYDIPWEDITWCTSKPEMVEHDRKKGVRLEPLEDGMKLDNALETGNVDAAIVPNLPRAVINGEGTVHRMFPDCIAEEKAYFKEVGDFPIMHLVVMRRDLLEREQWLGQAVMDMFSEAKSISDTYLDDPNWSRLAWARHSFEAQSSSLGDPWPIGFNHNKDNIARFIKYAADQNLISREMAPESLFPDFLLQT